MMSLRSHGLSMPSTGTAKPSRCRELGSTTRTGIDPNIGATALAQYAMDLHRVSARTKNQGARRVDQSFSATSSARSGATDTIERPWAPSAVCADLPDEPYAPHAQTAAPAHREEPRPPPEPSPARQPGRGVPDRRFRSPTTADSGRRRPSAGGAPPPRLRTHRSWNVTSSLSRPEVCAIR